MKKYFKDNKGCLANMFLSTWAAFKNCQMQLWALSSHHTVYMVPGAGSLCSKKRHLEQQYTSNSRMLPRLWMKSNRHFKSAIHFILKAMLEIGRMKHNAELTIPVTKMSEVWWVNSTLPSLLWAKEDKDFFFFLNMYMKSSLTSIQQSRISSADTWGLYGPILPS